MYPLSTASKLTPKERPPPGGEQGGSWCLWKDPRRLAVALLGCPVQGWWDTGTRVLWHQAGEQAATPGPPELFSTRPAGHGLGTEGHPTPPQVGQGEGRRREPRAARGPPSARPPRGQASLAPRREQPLCPPGGRPALSSPTVSWPMPVSTGYSTRERPWKLRSCISAPGTNCPVALVPVLRGCTLHPVPIPHSSGGCRQGPQHWSGPMGQLPLSWL